MHVKDKQYLANVFSRISASVDTVNEKITAHQNGKLSVDEFQATVALEQLAMQHETLIILAMLVADPALAAEPFPEIPKRTIGFN